MPELHRPDLFLDIVEEHFEELDFLWEQREQVVFAPDWSLEELAEHEERCEAHLQGLRIAGGHAVDLARRALSGDERGAAAAAAMVLFSFGSQELDREVLEAFASAEDPVREGIRVGLRHSDARRIAGELSRLATEAVPEVRVAAADVLAFHRLPPPRDLESLEGMLSGPARARLYAALGRFRGPWSLPSLRHALAEDEPEAQRAALETSARIGLPGLAGVCRDAAMRTGARSSAAVEFLGVASDPGHFEILAGLLADPGVARSAVAGLAALGDVRAVPLLIDGMGREEISADAGTAFRRLTGAPDIGSDEPFAPPEGLSEDEIDLLEPAVSADPAKAASWWNRERGRFDPAGIWQGGENLADDPLGEVFDRLALESRRDVYLGCRSGDPSGTPDLELEARAVLQRRRRC